MNRIRAWLFSAYMAIDTIIIGLISLPTLLNEQWAVRLSKVWVRSLEWGLRVIGGINRQVIGLDKLPQGPAIIAAKHQSMWETLILNVLLDRPAYVLKRELKNIPIFGWWTSACGFIFVDRTGGAASLKKMVADAERAIQSGKTHIVIFPEGTRVKAGETGRYHPGVAALAKALNLPIVPVAHNSGSHWRHHDHQLIPGTITLQFCEPLSPEQPRAKLMARLQDAIEPATRALEQELSTDPTAAAPEPS